MDDFDLGLLLVYLPGDETNDQSQDGKLTSESTCQSPGGYYFSTLNNDVRRREEVGAKVDLVCFIVEAPSIVPCDVVSSLLDLAFPSRRRGVV